MAGMADHAGAVQRTVSTSIAYQMFCGKYCPNLVDMEST